ncbi:MAG: adenylate kinase [Armatimonadetes bacterium]|nr:adenylate kinase [Armatimonadota bacterium]
MNLLLIGPPGVGKGTQAALLTQRLGLVQLASGDIFRAEIAAGSELGLRAKQFMDDGKLVPDEVTIGMMEARISSEKVRAAGFVLDGFPRTVEQSVALDALLDRLGVDLARVITLEIDDEVVVGRLSGRRVCPECGSVYHLQAHPPAKEGVCDRCGAQLVARDDDVPETIRARLQVFHQTTRPVIDHYEASGKLHRVDGDRGAEDVYSDMTEGLAV